MIIINSDYVISNRPRLITRCLVECTPSALISTRLYEPNMSEQIYINSYVSDVSRNLSTNQSTNQINQSTKLTKVKIKRHDLFNTE